MHKTSVRLLALTLCLAPLASSTWGANVVATNLGSVKAYPNPWRSDKHANTSIKFDNLPAASTVKVFTVSAEEVRSLSADSNGSVLWDRTNESGERVASGIYIYLVIDPQGNETSGKLAIIN